MCNDGFFYYCNHIKNKKHKYTCKLTQCLKDHHRVLTFQDKKQQFWETNINFSLLWLCQTILETLIPSFFVIQFNYIFALCSSLCSSCVFTVVIANFRLIFTTLYEASMFSADTMQSITQTWTPILSHFVVQNLY